MHLLTAKSTILNGMYGIFLLGYLIYILFHTNEKSVIELAFIAFWLVYGVRFWRKYLKAFTTRMDDRSYAEARDLVVRRLSSAVAMGEEISFNSEDSEVSIQRYKKIYARDSFFISITRDEEVMYDADTMTHTIFIPLYCYHIHKHQLFVSRSFDEIVLKVVKQDGSDKVLVQGEEQVDISLKEILKAERDIPFSLLHASVADLHELHSLLINRENGVAS